MRQLYPVRGWGNLTRPEVGDFAWPTGQVAADMKADGELDSGEISAALGHLSDATTSIYGHANMSKGCGVAPARMTAARPVKVRAHAKPAVKK